MQAARERFPKMFEGPKAAGVVFPDDIPEDRVFTIKGPSQELRDEAEANRKAWENRTTSDEKSQILKPPKIQRGLKSQVLSKP